MVNIPLSLFTGLMHPSWCRISAINTTTPKTISRPILMSPRHPNTFRAESTKSLGGCFPRVPITCAKEVILSGTDYYFYYKSGTFCSFLFDGTVCSNFQHKGWICFTIPPISPIVYILTDLSSSCLFPLNHDFSRKGKSSLPPTDNEHPPKKKITKLFSSNRFQHLKLRFLRN